MRITSTSIERLAAEAKEIRLAISGMIDGLSKNIDGILSTEDIIVKSDLNSLNQKILAVRTNLSPYADEVLSVTRSVAKPRKDGTRIEVDAALLDDLRAFRADVQDTLETIKDMEESFRKRANLHNIALGDFDSLLEPDPDILVPDVFAAGIPGNEPPDAVDATATDTE